MSDDVEVTACVLCGRAVATLNDCLDGDGDISGQFCWAEAPVMWPSVNRGREACLAIAARRGGK